MHPNVFFSFSLIVLGLNPKPATYNNSRVLEPLTAVRSDVCGFVVEKQTWKEHLLDWAANISANVA